MSSQAHQWSDQIKWQAVAGEPQMSAHFTDASVLTVSTQSNHKRLSTNSPAGTLAHQFAASLEPKTGFEITIKGLVFTFRDGSKLELELEGATIVFSDGPDKSG